MKIKSALILALIYNPKKLLRSRKVIALLLISAFIGLAIYIHQNGQQKQSIEQRIAVLQDQGADYGEIVKLMRQHIDSLNSRIQHLSTDNKRLSSTGSKLVQQLQDVEAQNKERLVRNKQMQLELYAVDQHLIKKFDSLGEQHEIYANLKTECEKAAANNKKCENYAQTKDIIAALSTQIKFLKEKREVLLSEISRADAGV